MSQRNDGLFMSGSHAPNNATGQSAVTQLHPTSSTEGDVYC